MVVVNDYSYSRIMVQIIYIGEDWVVGFAFQVWWANGYGFRS